MTNILLITSLVSLVSNSLTEVRDGNWVTYVRPQLGAYLLLPVSASLNLVDG